MKMYLKKLLIPALSGLHAFQNKNRPLDN